jgi:hypothetical protein
MKTLIATSVLLALLASGVAVMAQEQNDDYLGLPGDNLNLYAVMKLFQESKTLEEFERSLNDENSRINNLDLNNDNYIDYISVFDNVYNTLSGKVHNIVLQVGVNEGERQDIAVFTVDRDNQGNVEIQLTGDEELYGKNYIIEPAYDDSLNGQTPNPGYAGNSTTINGRTVTVVRTTSAEIAAWPIITYIYLPDYVGWRSSWYWGYYPSYWTPWRPYSWHYYYGYHYNWYDDYYSYYRPSHNHRHNYWNEYYYQPHHSHSAYVSVNIRDGHYKSTYSHPEQRKNGEALYSSTHRDNGTGSSTNTRTDNNSRRNASTTSPKPGQGNETGSSSRRSEGSGTTRTSTEKKSSESSKPQEGVSNRRTIGAGKSSEGRSSVQQKPAESRTSTPSSTKSASPERREAKTQSTQSKSTESKSNTAQPRSKESKSNSSQPKSKESSTKEESKRR